MDVKLALEFNSYSNYIKEIKGQQVRLGRLRQRYSIGIDKVVNRK